MAKFSLNYVWSKECDVSNLHIPHTTLRDPSGCLHVLGEIICPQDVDAQNLPEKEVGVCVTIRLPNFALKCNIIKINLS